MSGIDRHRIDRRTFLKYVGVAGAGLVGSAAAACVPGVTPTRPAPAAATPEPKTVRIGIDIPVHPFFNYLAARTDEFFGGDPWKLEMKIYSAQAQVTQMVRGNLDIVTSPAFAIPRIQKSQDIELQYFWPMARYTSWSGIVVRKDSPFETLEDLRGKRLASPPIEAEHGSELAALYGATGQRLDEYFAHVPTEEAGAELELGRADAAWLDPIPKVRLLEKGEFREVIDLAGLWEMALGDDRPVLSGGYIAQPSFVQQNMEFIAKFVKVNRDIWLRFMDDEDFRQEVYQVGGEFGGVPPDRLQFVAEALALANIPRDMLGVLEWDVEVYSKAFDWALKGGFPAKPVEDASKLFLLTKDLPI
ncbi:MAG: ABC transporter substrate-binding protein [Anaerolineae bacterium]